MRTARKHPRITDPQDVQVKLGSSGGSPGDRVLNLSEGGMLVANNKLKVGHQTAFEMTGLSFHYAGVAEVVHLTNETTGLRFLSWQGHDNRPVRSLIEQRSEWQAPKADAQRDQPVLRRVAVLTGRRRPSRQDTQPPGPKPAKPGAATRR
jgi:PilZ domain